jgi:hypothetical protein
MAIWASKTPRKQAPLNINVGVLNIGNDPESQHSCGFQGFIRDDYLFESFDHQDSPQITSVHAGCRGFAGANN